MVLYCSKELWMTSLRFDLFCCPGELQEALLRGFSLLASLVRYSSYLVRKLPFSLIVLWSGTMVLYCSKELWVASLRFDLFCCPKELQEALLRSFSLLASLARSSSSLVRKLPLFLLVLWSGTMVLYCSKELWMDSLRLDNYSSSFAFSLREIRFHKIRICFAFICH